MMGREDPASKLQALDMKKDLGSPVNGVKRMGTCKQIVVRLKVQV